MLQLFQQDKVMNQRCQYNINTVACNLGTAGLSTIEGRHCIKLYSFFLYLFLVSLTGSWKVPIFVVVVILLIVGSQEKPPVPGRGEDLRKTHTFTFYRSKRLLSSNWMLIVMIKRVQANVFVQI